MKPEWIFRLFETSHARTLVFRQTDKHVDYQGKHSGYVKNDISIEHTRSIRFDRITGGLAISDCIPGSIGHRIKWHFHLAPGVSVNQESERSLLLEAQNVSCRMTFDFVDSILLTDGWYSPSYGVKQTCTVIDLVVNKSFSEKWFFTISPLNSNWQHEDMRQNYIKGCEI